jgi:hypothetical protein
MTVPITMVARRASRPGAHDAETLRRESHTHILTSAASIPEMLGLVEAAQR